MLSEQQYLHIGSHDGNIGTQVNLNSFLSNVN